MTYEVKISFNGFIGADEYYEIEASSQEEAEELALEEARGSLIVKEIVEIEE